MRIVTLLNRCVKCCHWSITPIILAILFLSPLEIFSQAANLDQIRNGPANDPSKNFWDNFDNPQHVNGNAGESNAHYVEGHSISYRSLITGVTIGKVYEYTIEYDTKHSGRMAIDYLTHFQRLEPHQQFNHPAETINPLIFETGSNEYLLTPVSTNTFPIPVPQQDSTPVTGQPQTSFNALDPSERLFTIYNGLIASIVYVREEPLTTSATESKTSVRIRFTAHDDSVVLAWGGHIASQLDWGFLNPTTPRSAAGISGSPYHMRHLGMRNVTDGQNISLGNQDRSLSARAVIAPPTCGISPAQLACPETDTLTFRYQNGATTGMTFLWTIVNDSAGAVIASGANDTIVKIVPSGTDFIAGKTFDLKLKVTRSGISDSCTRAPAAIIQNVQVNATATPDTINLAADSTVDLLATVTPGPSDVATYSFKWTQVPAVGGSLSNDTIPNPVFTAQKADDYRFYVTVTQRAAPNCVAVDSVDVTVLTSEPLCGISGPDPVCPSSTNTYKYDPNNDGVADPIPANFTLTWDFENNTNGATLNGNLNDTTVTVTASVLCETSYILRIILVSTSGTIRDTCTKEVNVNVNAPLSLTCPGNKTVACGASTDPADTDSAKAADNGCGIKIYYKDVITRTWIAEDACGNKDTCTQTITVDSCILSNTLPNGSGARMITNAAPAPTTQGLSKPVTTTVKSPINSKPVLSPKTTSNTAIKELQVQAFPNPFSNTVNFRFTSPVSGRAVLEVFNTQGQRVGIAFDGKIDAGIAKSVQFSTRLTNQALIYKLKVGDKTIRGTVLELKR